MWAAKTYSLHDQDEGFSHISGISGSGKSHLTKLFLLDALREVESNPYAKLIVYEPKRQFYAWMSSLGLSSRITYFMPSDTRGVSLDFAEDYKDDKDTMTLAHAFYPERPSQQESPFWGQSLRTIFAGVYSAIKAKLGRADMRLVCLVLEDEELTRKVLSYDPYLVQANKLTAVSGKTASETAQNIQLTIASRVGELKSLAAHLDCAARERPLFSLRRFIREPGSGVLVISDDEDYGLAQKPMNGVLFQRFTQLLDKEQNDPRRKIFVVIDEFPALCGENRCPGVKTMFLRLRDRGAVPLITDQGLTTLKPIYGDDTTALLGQCSNVIYLKQPDSESAEDASKKLGTERGYEKKSSVSYGGEYASITMSPQWYDRPIFSASDLMDLPKASRRNGVEGIAKSDLDENKGPRRFKLSPDEVDRIPPTRKDIHEEYEEREKETQRLRSLDDAERKSLLRDGNQPEDPNRWAKFLMS
jgi:hypothetical protein